MAILSLAILCITLAITLQTAAGESNMCPPGSPAGTGGNSMYPNAPGYMAGQETGYGYFPTITAPKFPTVMPGHPMPINRTRPTVGPTPYPRPTIMPGMPLPTLFPGYPFPGRTSPTPMPTATLAPTIMPSPTLAPTVTPVPTSGPTASPIPAVEMSP
jgi:hypothetical protein